MSKGQMANQERERRKV